MDHDSLIHQPIVSNKLFCGWALRILFAMAGFIPAIHVLLCMQDVDGRDRPGHQELIAWSEAEE
jgi:hypothetical protein